MNMGQSKENNTLVLTPEGKLDSNSAHGFETSVLKSIDNGENSIIIDFSKVYYMSSAGLRTLLVIAKKMKEANGKISIYNVSGEVSKVIYISRFDKIINVFSSKSEALENVD